MVIVEISDSFCRSADVCVSTCLMALFCCMDASSSVGGSDLTTPGNDMSHSLSISSVASSSKSHGSILNRETIAKVVLDNVLKIINNTGKSKSNDTIV